MGADGEAFHPRYPRYPRSSFCHFTCAYGERDFDTTYGAGEAGARTQRKPI